MKTLIFVLFLFIAACGPWHPQPTSTITPTIALEGSKTPLEATSTPIPSPTPQPTATPTPPPPPPPPVEPIFAVDVSNYWQPGPVSNEQARIFCETFIEAGFSHLIAGTQRPSIAYQQLSSAQSVGMTTAIYVELSTHSDIDAEMRQALYASEGIPLTATWIAFEVPPPPGWSAEDWMDAALHAAVEAGFPNVGIYTANWWWSVWVHDSERFAKWPLWYANYNGIATVDWEREHFGAWVAPALKQYAGSVTELNRVASLIEQTYGYVPANIIPEIAYDPGDGPNVDLNVSYTP